MSLLALEGVGKSLAPAGRRTPVGLRDIWLEVEAGELIAVWGARASGRTTLLRLAAGLDHPDEGRVLFDGRDLRDVRDRVLGREIGYVQAGWSIAPGEPVLEHVALAGHMHGDGLAAARQRAYGLLKRVGALGCADLHPRQLSRAETTRVLLARALMSGPRLILLDEPATGAVLERDPILQLVRSVADEGVAVLMTIGESTEFLGATRALTLDDGELRGALVPSEGEVVPLRSRGA